MAHGSHANYSALSLQGLWFDPCTGTFHMLQVAHLKNTTKLESEQLQMETWKQPWTKRFKHIFTHLVLKIVACHITTPISQMRKSRWREANSFVQGPNSRTRICTWLV